MGPLKALFGCACIRLNPHVLKWNGTYASKQGLNLNKYRLKPLNKKRERDLKTWQPTKWPNEPLRYHV
jgi:hypothetical protein